MTTNSRFNQRAIAWLTVIAIFAVPVQFFAQGTNVDAPDNRYSLGDDVKLGREAGAEVERRMPVLSEGSDVDDYVERVGRRLVNGIPREFQHSEFNYEFDVVNARDVTGRTEIVTVYTTMLRDGNLFYLIAVAPQDQSSVYSRAFQTMLGSIEINT